MGKGEKKGIVIKEYPASLSRGTVQFLDCGGDYMNLHEGIKL